MSKTTHWTVRLVTLTALCALMAMALVPAAEACTQRVRPPVAWVIPHEYCCPFNGGPCFIRAWIIFHNYATFGAGPGQFCACSLNVGGPILGVDGATIANAQTGERIAGFSFNSNAATSASGGGITGGSAAGFLADVSRAIPNGIPVDIMFDVRLKEGSVLNGTQTLEEFLLTEGFLVTGEGSAEGEFTGGHLDVALAEQVEVTPPGSTVPSPK